MVSYSQNVKDCKAMIKELNPTTIANQMAAEAGWWEAAARQYWEEIERLKKDIHTFYLELSKQ